MRWLQSFALLLGFNCVSVLYGQQPVAADSDSVTAVAVSCPSDWIASSRLLQTTAVSVPLIAEGFLLTDEKTHFRDLRYQYFGSTDLPYDNVTQFLPLITTVTLKLCGVESNDSWEKMMHAGIISYMTMTAIVDPMKDQMRTHRPALRGKNSFPSGHTATSFLMASILDKEYGDAYPWLSVTGYSVATLTGLTRIYNDKHWISDVTAGAGIGLLCGEFGYWMADLMFPDSKTTKAKCQQLSNDGNPSFVGLNSGMIYPLVRFKPVDGIHLATNAGGNLGLQGAYFFNPNVGFGGDVDIANIGCRRVEADKSMIYNLDFLRYGVGPYFSLPLFSHLHLGSKLLGGWVNYAEFDRGGEHFDKEGGVCLTSGVSMNSRVRRYFTTRLYCDYVFQHRHRSTESGMPTQYLSVGTCFSVAF